MLGLLDRIDVEGEAEEGSESDRPGVDPAAAVALTAGPDANRAPLSSWQDIDKSLAEYCATKGIAVPGGIEDAIALHLLAMAAWLDDLERRVGAGGDGSKGEPS
jgi:hypothetical protein